jgi:hypothetical protein
MAKGDIDFTKIGRPIKFETPEDIWNEAVKYFEESKNASGKYQPTMDGLTFHMGFSSRSSWVDYGKRSPEFSHMVDKIKMFVRSCYEKQLYGFAWAGSQFALRNIGKEDWKDEITEHQNQTITKVVIEEKTRDEK